MKKTVLLAQGKSYNRVAEGLFLLRTFWENRLYEVFPESQASLLCAMLLGDRENLESEQKELYRRNGIVHILSISGLHISLIGMGAFELLRRLRLSDRASAFCSGVVLLGYGVMTGMSLSACRAIGMYGIRMLSKLCRRTYDMQTALGVLAAVLLWSNPFYFGHAGFWLSFSSLLGVGLVYPKLFGEPKRPRGKASTQKEKKKKLLEDVWWTGRNAFLVSLSILLTTLPIQLWFSYEIPVYSVLINLVVLPCMSILMVSGFFAMLVPGTGIVGTAAGVILTGYEWICRLAENLPGHTWNPGRPSAWKIVFYFAVLFFLMWKKQKRVCKYLLLLGGVLLFAVKIPEGDRVTFLDVGQGDCAVVETKKGAVYLFDCGSSSRSLVGERVLFPFLKFRGIERIDGVFVSHGDEDHINGIVELLEKGKSENITIGKLILPKLPREQMRISFQRLADALKKGGYLGEIEVCTVQSGEVVGEEGEFVCLHPSENFSAATDNETSMCIYGNLNGLTFLFTGDVEGAGEKEMTLFCKEREISFVHCLKISHHGSAYATSEEFLNQLDVKLGVVSCGRNNRYGHPSKETLERLSDAGIRIFRTDENGAVWVKRKGKGIRITRMRG